MDDSLGWILISRKMEKWRWVEDPLTLALWIHLLLMANYEDKDWRGISIKRGSLVTSVAKLVKRTGLTTQNVRTALTRLKSTKELTMVTTDVYTHISINNYDKYQLVTNKLTSSQQGANKVLTTTKQSNKYNKLNKDIYPSKLYGDKWTLEQVADLVVEVFNDNLGTGYKKSRIFIKGLEKWLEVYSPQEIEDAIIQVKHDKFWNGKMTPTLLFRQKNPQGEPVDYIGGLLNSKKNDRT